MTRLNITLPDEIAKKLAQIHNKSRFIAEVLKEKFEQEKQKKIEMLMIEGYKATCLEDKKINDEWEQTSLDKWE